MLRGIHLICSDEVTIPSHIDLWWMKSTDSTFSCWEVTFLGKTTCLLQKTCRALLLAAISPAAAGLPAARFPAAASLAALLLSPAPGSVWAPLSPWQSAGYGAYIAFSDAELLPPSSIASHSDGSRLTARYSRSGSFRVQPAWKCYFLEMYQ